VSGAQSPLLQHRSLGASFDAGLTALGHGWKLFDADEQQVGQTERVFQGAGKVFGRFATATGLDKGDGIRADVKDADGEPVIRLYSVVRKGKPQVELGWPDGTPIGTVWRTKGEGLRFEVGPSATVVARIAVPDDLTEPWSLTDQAGTEIGAMARTKAKKISFSYMDNWLLDGRPQASDFQATMHFGFAFSKEYAVRLDDDANLADPLRVFAVLAPVIAGYSY
jgi:hypothetical protein